MAVSRINEAGLNVNQFGNRNLIINGAMRVAQRGASSANTTSLSGYFTVDRFSVNNDYPSGVTSMSFSQDTDAPDGFSNSFKVTPDQARDAALSGADRAFVNYNIEAQDLQQLDYNTSSAKNMTLSFYIKSNLTGVVSLEFNAPDATDSNFQSLHQSVTINSANTWERKTVSIPGNVNNPINNDNGTGLGFSFIYAAGPVFTSGTFTTGVWHDTTTGNRASSSNIDIFSSASNFVSITGVQLEVGDTATDFEHRSFGDELAKCQRYFQTLGGTNTNDAFAAGFTTNANFFGYGHLNNTMRAAPTGSVSGTNSHLGYTHTAVAAAANGAPTITANINGFHIQIGSGTTTTSIHMN